MGVQKKASERKKATSCESCTFYAWDDEYEYYVCEADLDEDEMSSFLSGTDFPALIISRATSTGSYENRCKKR